MVSRTQGGELVWGRNENICLPKVERKKREKMEVKEVAFVFQFYLEIVGIHPCISLRGQHDGLIYIYCELTPTG